MTLPPERLRFNEICDMLQLPQEKRPGFKVIDEKREGKREIWGQYHRWTNVITLSRNSPNIDYTLLHEITHAVCAKQIRYLGSHDVPFLALHDLICAFYWIGSEPPDIQKSQWSKIASKAMYARSKESTRSIVTKGLAHFREQGFSIDNPPGIDLLADYVKRSDATRFCFDWRRNVFAVWRCVDPAWTQAQAVYFLIGKALAWLLFLTLIGAVIFKSSWLFKVTLISSVSLVAYTKILKWLTGVEPPSST